jgi:hypothetical protein
MTFPRYGKIKHVPNHQPEHSYGKSSSGWWCNNHLEKYEFVNFVRIIPCMKWTIKHEFETTNQSFLCSVNQLFLWAMASTANCECLPGRVVFWGVPILPPFQLMFL